MGRSIPARGDLRRQLVLDRTRLSRDSHHADAAELLEQAPSTTLVTSNHVRGEVWTFLRRRPGYQSAMHFLAQIGRMPRVRVELVSEELKRDALDWLRVHDERPYSLVDATSFALMRRLGTRDAFALGGDFTAAGFTELRP